jgi:hypothetical protein
MLVDEAKLGASTELFIKGDIDSEKMKAKLRHAQKVREEDNQIRGTVEARFQAFRSYLLIAWILSNGKTNVSRLSHHGRAIRESADRSQQ